LLLKLPFYGMKNPQQEEEKSVNGSSEDLRRIRDKILR
jgi:hypothetical protein